MLIGRSFCLALCCKGKQALYTQRVNSYQIALARCSSRFHVSERNISVNSKIAFEYGNVASKKTVQSLSLLGKERVSHRHHYHNSRCFSSSSSSYTETDEQTVTESQATTHFGFKTVKEDEKVEKVYEVFKNVAESYDLMNDMMSVGIHRLWKDEFIRHLSPHGDMKLLDVAGGTGDIAFRYLNYSSSDEVANKEGREVTICDINEHMLKVGERRALKQGITQGITWLHGNAECLPIEDSSYDAYTIAFGIRNCTHVKQVLAEAYRVLKPGGRFLCLEFSEVNNTLLRAIYDQYSFQVIPVLGHVIAQDWNSYQYLVESIRKFPNQNLFKSWIEEAGFSSVNFTNMTFGAVAIHSGFKF